MGKANPFGVWQQYPEPQGHRSGCKVSWNYYADRADAEKCAEAAKHNARIQVSQGYDFGYCSPGWIQQIAADREEFAGLFEVCLP
jgi:hypothetical protein